MTFITRRAVARAAVLALAGALLVLGSAARPSPSGQSASITAGSATVGLGQQASVKLQAFDIPAPGAGAWFIDVVYDPDLMAATGCSVPQPFAVCNQFVLDDTVRIAGADADGLEGDFDLATIDFLCGNGGTSPLSVVIYRFADNTSADIPVNVTDGSITCSTELIGDASCDDVVNSLDALLILQLAVGFLGQLPCPNGDVNGDAAVDPVDATLVLQYTVGLLGHLP